jgi:hypothetical protein
VLCVFDCGPRGYRPILRPELGRDPALAAKAGGVVMSSAVKLF